ncbi:MAG: response regulator [Bacteroidetes bacterium]|nr:response regulator [Bacteroidota bacterium]
MINSTFKNANILVIDDKEANIEVLAGLLEIQGYRNVITTSDSRTAVSLFKSFGPDLILLDLMMPHLSGFEVMDQLKALIPETTYLPILVLTADITTETRQRALLNGAKDFLSKPFDLIEVGLRIDNLLFARFLHLESQNRNQALEEKVKERTLELEIANHELIVANEIIEEREKKLQKLNAELEHRVEQRTLQFETANKELEAFSYSISHDLRAPLRHITGFIDILLDMKTVERSEEELHYLEIISGGASEMGKLITGLLSFSSLNRTELRKTKIRSAYMVKQVVNFFEPEIKNRDLTFKIGKIPDCEGDEQLLKQVWINLISNAIKYTGKKAEAIVEIGSTSQDGYITYFVKDNGAGFNMNNVEKLFGVFQRLHKSSDFEGIGIGLANVNSIVTRHGGHCSARGKPDEGATFFFSLPDSLTTSE